MSKWTPIFIPPDLMDLVKDWLLQNGDKEKVWTPRIFVIRAVEEYLSRRGYQVQIDELREAVKQKRPVRVFTLEKLSDVQKEAVRLIMKYKQWDEQTSIKWVLDHESEVNEAVREV